MEVAIGCIRHFVHADMHTPAVAVGFGGGADSKDREFPSVPSGSIWLYTRSCYRNKSIAWTHSVGLTVCTRRFARFCSIRSSDLEDSVLTVN